MARYADLVAEALAARTDDVRFSRLSLAAPEPLLRLVPRRFATWAHHAWILATARWRLPSPGQALLHVVDGSHAYLCSSLAPRRFVLTMHDLIPVLQAAGEVPGPEPSRLSRWLWRRTFRNARRAARVVADSRRTADDLVRHGNVEAQRVLVVSPAVAPLWRDGTSPEKADSRFLLHVGNGAFYKARPMVLRVLARVRERCDVRLTMAGAPPDSHLRSLAASLGVIGALDWVREPSDSELAELYRRASVLLFPSLYEGFGWPPLEAMAAGCPVVCSTAASLPEVVGDAALTCPPDDEPGFAERVLAVLADDGLRGRLVQQGRQRAALFSLERLGDGLLDAYRAALAEAAA
jgi:glycosyltransferase involved in cell wall biosynthesis